MLSAVEHDCKIDVKSVTREFIECIIYELENQHISDVEIVFLESINASFELFDRSFKVSYGTR